MTGSTPHDRARTPVTSGAVMAVLAVLAAAAMGCPFVRTGTRTRSAYATVRSARVLDLLDGRWRGVGAALISVTPVMASLVVLLSVAGSSASVRVARRALLFSIGGASIAVGLLGLRVSGIGLPGPPATAVLGALCMFITLWDIRRNRSVDAEPRPPRHPLPHETETAS